MRYATAKAEPGGKGRGRPRPAGRRSCGALLAAGCLLAATGQSQERRPVTLEIWTANAPLASVLEQLIDQESFDVRVGEGVEGVVSGRLEGTVGEVLEPLLDSYELTVHHDGTTVWFDRRGRDIVEHVSLEPEREPMLTEWVARELGGTAPNGKGRVEREPGGLLVSGTRAFVQETLGRIEAARGALGEEEDGTTAVRQPPAALAMPEPLAADDTAVAASGAGDGAAGRRYRSISDVPGYATEYR